MRIIQSESCSRFSLPFSFLLVFAVLFAGQSFASDKGVKNSDAALPIPHRSELFESCKESVASPNFEVSYCADLLRNALYGFTWITSSTPPSNWGKCDKELKANENAFKWLRYLPKAISLVEIAKRYVSQKSANAIQPLASPFLMTDDEQELASVIASYKHRAGTALNKSFENELGKRLDSKTPYWLYESCRSVRDPMRGVTFIGDYCDAVVSGLWIGYAVAYSTLPNIGDDHICEGKRARQIENLRERYWSGFACDGTRRKTNFDTAIAYIDSVERRTPSQLLRLADEPPHLEVVRQISALCKKK